MLREKKMKIPRSTLHILTLVLENLMHMDRDTKIFER